MALSERHQQILVFMEVGIEYSTEQVTEKIGLTIVYNGNYSALSGILKGEGTIQANQTYDLVPTYYYMYFDGISIVKPHLDIVIVFDIISHIRTKYENTDILER